MDANEMDNAQTRANSGRHETIGGVLAAALNMEDDISGGVYLEYLERSRWPAQLDDDVFVEIERRLTLLIEGIAKHKKILRALVREHGRDA